MRLLLLSTSTVYGGGYLEYARERLRGFLGDAGPLLFVPWARPGGISHEEYAASTADALEPAGIELRSLHEAPDPRAAVRKAAALFVGGGNTFVLLRDLYRDGLLEAIRERVAEGTPYVGSSAGTNVAGLTIGTTNDMPIVAPPRFDALGLVPFNFNPHYLDPDPDSRHMGESRETRIVEFHRFQTQPVLGLREGAVLAVEEGEARLEGRAGARLFRHGRDPTELPPGADVAFLLAGAG